MKTNEIMWFLGQFISLGAGLFIWGEYSFAAAFAVSYGISVLVDIRKSVAGAE